MFGRKSRGQVIGEELTEGLSHVRSAASEATKAAAEALAPRVEAARDAVTPRVEAAREALTKGYDTARVQAEERFAAAREQAESRRSGIAEQGRRKANKAAKQMQKSAEKNAKNAKQIKKAAVVARKDAKAAVADAKAQAKATSRDARSGSSKKRRRWPFVLVIVGVIGAVVARSRAKTDDDLWGAPSDSPVRGYTEDPHPSSSVGTSSTPATEDPYPGTTADSDGTIAEKTDDYKAVAPSSDGPLHGKLADSAEETGTSVGESPEAQDETWSEMIEATQDNNDAGNAEEAAKHAVKEPTKKSKGS